jgi:hypothetical protein
MFLLYVLPFGEINYIRPMPMSAWHVVSPACTAYFKIVEIRHSEAFETTSLLLCSVDVAENSLNERGLDNEF